MKKILLIVLSGCLGLTVSAQRMALSEREEISLRSDDFAIIGKCRGMNLLYKNRSGIAEVLFYNKELQKVKVSTLNFLPEDPKEVHFSHTDRDLSVFYEQKDGRFLKVYAARMLDDFTWSEPRLLDSVSSTAYRYSAEFHILSSADQQLTAVYGMYRENGIGSFYLRSRIVDQQLNLLSEINQAISDVEFNATDEAILTAQGRLFIAASDSRLAKNATSKFYLLQAGKGDTVFSFDELPLGGHVVRDICMADDTANQNLYLCAYFADSKYGQARGLYFSTYDYSTLAIGLSHFTPLVLQGSSSRTDLQDLKIRKLLIRKGGELDVIAERSYQQTRTISSVAPTLSTSYIVPNMAESSRVVTEFYNDEIVIFDLKIDGSLAWSQTVVKEQVSSDDNAIYSSFGMLQHRSGNAFIFNDLSNRQNRLLVCYVSGNGEMNIKELQTNEAVEDWNLMPRSAVQVSKTEILMPCVMKGYLCLLKISY